VGKRAGNCVPVFGDHSLQSGYIGFDLHGIRCSERVGGQVQGICKGVMDRE